MGKERFAALTGTVDDEFGREIISGFAANVDEVGTAVNRFRESGADDSDVRRAEARLAEGRQISWARA